MTVDVPTFLCLVVLLPPLSTGLAGAQPPDDDEEREFRRASASRAVRENCLICHSDEIIRTQRLTLKQWKTEVEKMTGWGSPLPVEQQSDLITYLAAEFPAEGPPPSLVRQALPQSPATETAAVIRGEARRGERIFAQNCANCHGADGQGSDLGPNLVEKPVLNELSRYQNAVRTGLGRMPAFGSVLDPAAAADTLVWLRGRRYRPLVVQKK
jgi:ubiquinol-cytochrome c reductase cytochrome c subunit